MFCRAVVRGLVLLAYVLVLVLVRVVVSDSRSFLVLIPVVDLCLLLLLLLFLLLFWLFWLFWLCWLFWLFWLFWLVWLFWSLLFVVVGIYYYFSLFVPARGKRRFHRPELLAQVSSEILDAALTEIVSQECEAITGDMAMGVLEAM